MIPAVLDALFDRRKISNIAYMRIGKLTDGNWCILMYFILFG